MGDVSDVAVWKFPLQVADVQQVLMPQGARLLTVQVQDDTPCLWAVVDPASRPVVRWIHTAGTGHTWPAKSLSEHISTYQLHGGALVFHVFDGGEP